MYKAFFHLTEDPFSITPDPRFLFLSRRHQEALAHLLFSISGASGFILLTGEVGTGKTTLSRCLIEQLPPNTDLALIFNPRLTAAELVASICDELKIPYPAGTTSLKVLVDLLNRHLLESHTQGRATLLVLDEAQNLSPDLLEQVRLLTNLETATRKLLQIILIGQPELAEILARSELRQLSQRVTARYHIDPLNLEETGEYIRHRLAVAGCTDLPFSKRAVRQIHNSAGGIPRMINKICDRALLGAYTLEKHQVDLPIARQAAQEVLGELRTRKHKPRVLHAALAAGVVLLAAVTGWFLPLETLFWPAPPPESQPAPPAPPAEPPPLVPLPAPQAQEPAPAPPPLPAPQVQEPAPATPPEPVAGGVPTSAPDPAASAPELETVLADPAARLDYQAAMVELLRSVLPGRELIPRANVCSLAQMEGVACLSLPGNWEILKRLGLPVVLRFTSPEWEARFAVLVEVKEDRARVRFKDREATFSRAALERFWFGRLHMVWKPPQLPFQTQKKGMRGEAVVWLRRALERVTGTALPGEDPALFDPELERRLRTFQWQQGLEPDGKAGALTFIILAAAPAGGP